MSQDAPDPAQVKALFFEALELPVEQLPAFLDQRCGADDALRAELASLLDFHDEAELIVQAPAPAPAGDTLSLCGQTLDGRYRVDAFVAEGGFGFVYRAWHLRWDQPVAIKVFKPFPGEEPVALMKAFAREGALLSQLSRRTTAIVQSYDLGTLTTPSGVQLLYIALEWLDGVPLSRWSGPPEGWTAASLHRTLSPVAEALAVAHAAGVAHRDIKPDNVFVLDPDGLTQLKVLDFGVAKVAADREGGFQATGTGLGAFSPNYAAPEQLTAAPTGPWTDVYALAMLCVELLAGQHPYAGTSPLMALMRVGDPLDRPTPRAVGVVVGDAVEAVFARALAVAVEERFTDAAAFWGALGVALG